MTSWPHQPQWLKRKDRHVDEIFVAGCIGSCHFGNFQCNQWQKFNLSDNSCAQLMLFLTVSDVYILPYLIKMTTFQCRCSRNLEDSFSDWILIQFAMLITTIKIVLLNLEGTSMSIKKHWDPSNKKQTAIRFATTFRESRFAFAFLMWREVKAFQIIGNSTVCSTAWISKKTSTFRTTVPF